MPYRLKHSESFPEGIRRIVAEEVESSLEQLNGTGDRDKAIHEARKSVKKIRGLIRLVQPHLGSVYQTENEALRNMGRRLSAVRDASVMLEIADDLLDTHKEGLNLNAFAVVRRGLEAHKRQVSSKIGALIRSTTRSLRSVVGRTARWPVPDGSFDTVLAPGLKSRYRRGVAAMRAAAADRTPESLHTWRRRVKDHWYHVRLLENSWDDLMREHEANLRSLETSLGDDHNLHVFCGLISAHPGKYGSPAEIDVLLGLVARRQDELRKRSFEIGRQAYRLKPTELTAECTALWKERNHQPSKKPSSRAQGVGRKTAAA